MDNAHEMLVSASDAEKLSLMLGGRHHPRSADAGASDALAELLTEARLVPDESLPANRVAMNSRVTYEEETARVRRTVTLVHPSEANASEGRISVLSPIGRALLGRGPGAAVHAGAPMGRELTIHILAVDN